MPISCPQCHAEMPDNVAFCPGCGRRMWVAGQQASRPSPPRIRTPEGNTPVGTTPPVSIPIQPRDNLIAAAAYITIIPAIFFLLVEPFKHNRFVRFHSLQSIFLAGATIVAGIAMRILFFVLALIPTFGYLLAWLASAVVALGWVILWLVLLVKALQGETFRLPWIGSLAERV
jgi:uncharacterized membrane protein